MDIYLLLTRKLTDTFGIVSRAHREFEFLCSPKIEEMRGEQRAIAAKCLEDEIKSAKVSERTEKERERKGIGLEMKLWRKTMSSGV